MLNKTELTRLNSGLLTSHLCYSKQWLLYSGSLPLSLCSEQMQVLAQGLPSWLRSLPSSPSLSSTRDAPAPLCFRRLTTSPQGMWYSHRKLNTPKLNYFFPLQVTPSLAFLVYYWHHHLQKFGFTFDSIFLPKTPY